MVERQSCKLTVLGAIPSGGCCDKRSSTTSFRLAYAHTDKSYVLHGLHCRGLSSRCTHTHKHTHTHTPFTNISNKFPHSNFLSSFPHVKRMTNKRDVSERKRQNTNGRHAFFLPVNVTPSCDVVFGSFDSTLPLPLRSRRSLSVSLGISRRVFSNLFRSNFRYFKFQI